MKKAVLLCCLVLFVAPRPARASDAVVLDISDCGRDCGTSSGGLTKYDLLSAGQQIKTGSTHQTVTLLYSDGRRVPVIPSKSVYTVEPSTVFLGVAWDNLWQTIKGALARGREERGTLLSRGPAFRLKMSCLADGSAQVAAGVYTLGVAWEGGVAPFAVTVTNPAGHLVVTEDHLTHHELVVRTHQLQLSAGRYRITVADSSRPAVSPLQGSFAVVPALPPTPDAIALLPEPQRTIAAADWLAWSDDPSHCYAAYLSLMPLTFGPAADTDAIATQADIREYAVHR